MEQGELVPWLAAPGVLPGSVDGVEVRETHASVVFLTRERAFKLKKPVDFGFLDYSTPGRRLRMCRREVALNRRLAPGVYLGVRAVREGPGGAPCIGGRGRVIDHLVEMRRLADEDSLAARLALGEAGEAECRAVAAAIARFHATAPAGEARRGRVPAVRVSVMENFRQLAEMPGVAMPAEFQAALRAKAARFLRDSRVVLAARAAAGAVRECHGDLRAEHVYLTAGDDIEVIDCIEFNRRLSEIDVAADIAFLVMDVAAAGHWHQAGAIAEEYRERSGDALEGVLEFYASYRAVVRAKVAGLFASGHAPDDPAQENALIEARRYAWAALEFATPPRRPVLAITGGLTGTGKSWLAEPLAAVLAAERLNADRVRKELGGVPAGVRVPARPDEGLYRPEMNVAVYGALLERAAGALAAGRNVVLDGTFRRKGDRAAAAAVAAAAGALFFAIECTAPAEEVRRRLDRRQAEGSDPWSDGRWEVYLAQAAAAERWPESDGAAGIRVDTTAPRVTVLDAVLTAMADMFGLLGD